VCEVGEGTCEELRGVGVGVCEVGEGTMRGVFVTDIP